MTAEHAALALFWSAVGVLVYTYVGFPFITWLRAVLMPRPYQTGCITPPITVVVAAHNEATTIGDRIGNILRQDYPSTAIEIVVASDGSTDATNDIVRAIDSPQVRLLDLPRRGKGAALNAAVAAATNDIVVFTDANTAFAPDAIRNLIRPFTDPLVGGVAGDQRYTGETDRASAPQGERNYWDFDRSMKRWQSRAGNTISATGAIYAIRRSLFDAIPSGAADDFVCSTRVIEKGYRLVFAHDAVAYEAVAASNRVEFSRKVRIMTQGFRSVFLMRSLMNPLRYGFYSFQLVSHKLLRRLSAFPLLVLLIASPSLWQQGVIYQVATAMQGAFYGCAAIGFVSRNRRLGHLKMFSLPFFVTMVYAGSLLALCHILLGRRLDVWQPQRMVSHDSGPSTSPAS